METTTNFPCVISFDNGTDKVRLLPFYRVWKWDLNRLRLVIYYYKKNGKCWEKNLKYVTHYISDFALKSGTFLLRNNVYSLAFLINLKHNLTIIILI